MSKEDLYHLGAKLYEEEKFAEAILVLSKAYAIDQKDVDIIVLLAGCYIYIARFTEAARLLLEADKISSNDPIVKYNLGYALLCMGRLDDAMRYINECLQLNPEQEIKNMAKRMLKSKEFFAEKLENNYKLSLEEEFECQDNFSRAQEYLYTKKISEAISLYKHILEKKPDFHRAIQNIGVCYIQQGNPEEALKHFEKALSISPNDELCLGNIAHAHYLLGNSEKSNEYSKKVVDIIKKPLLRDLIRLVTLFIEIGQLGFARKLLNDYCDANNNAQLTFLSGILYAKQKQYSAAKEEFQSISKVSNVAKEYLKNVELILDGRITEFNFELKMAIDASEDMI